MKSVLRFAVLSLCIFAFVGCNKKGTGREADVSGSLKYKGAAVTGGLMTFHFADKGGIPVTLNADGTFKGTSLPMGDAVVTVDTGMLEGKGADYGKVMGGGAGAAGGGMSPVPKDKQKGAAPGVFVKIPPKYNDKDKSDLKVTVKAGSNNLGELTLND